ncbi:MAG: hypothetical protein C5B60_09925 [Chloroflexi bacterium]|nr:MAG: hypothetical protein C5B60_09925 [Chloroflexota bacterium]
MTPEEEVKKLRAILAHSAGFLQGIAARINHWRVWNSANTEDFRKAAEDCDALGRKLAGLARVDENG